MFGTIAPRRESFKVGDKVYYRGGWGREPAKSGTIIGIGEKNDQVVFDVALDDGDQRWGYANQFSRRSA